MNVKTVSGIKEDKMASRSKKRKCKNTHYDRGGEKGKIHYLKGYAMYHKKERVAYNKEVKEQLTQ
jgi:hypothetical protein